MLDSVGRHAPPSPPPGCRGSRWLREQVLSCACSVGKMCGGRSGAGKGGPGLPSGGIFPRDRPGAGGSLIGSYPGRQPGTSGLTHGVCEPAPRGLVAGEGGRGGGNGSVQPVWCGCGGKCVWGIACSGGGWWVMLWRCMLVYPSCPYWP